MTTPKPPLPEIDDLDLDAASGAFKTAGREGSKNVLDCRGPNCLDWTGKIDPIATREHKGRPPVLPEELPSGDGGGLGRPKIPG